MQMDENSLRDAYGSEGHIFADIKASPRFLEEPGQLDLVYQIEEGDMFRVGKINIHVSGESPHTRRDVVLNRLSLRPGDIVDIREVRASERRLKASDLFISNPAEGAPPRIVIRPPDLAEAASLAERPSGYRGQSPDDHAVRRGGTPDDTRCLRTTNEERSAVIGNRMVTAHRNNPNRLPRRYGLLLALALVAVSGCAGMGNPDPRTAWPAASPHTVSPPASPAAPTATPPPSPTTSPFPTTVQPAGPAATSPQSPAAPPAVTVRGQGDWDGNDELPGSDAHMRYPMPASGSGSTAYTVSAQGQPARTALQPPATTATPPADDRRIR